MEELVLVANEVFYKSCPLCGGSDLKDFGSIKYRAPVLFSSVKIALRNSSRLCRCKACHSSFTQYTVSEESARSLYSQGSAADRWDTSDIKHAKTKKVVEELSQLFQAGLKVLDIGANTGTILDFAAAKGCRTYAVEYSASSRDFLAKNNHQVFASIDDVHETFDIICAFDLIEHVYDVPGFLNKVRSLLSSQGKLISLTGNPNSPSAFMAKAKWWYSKAPEHVVFPSPKFLSSFKGFKTLKTVKTYASPQYQHSYPYALFNLLKGLLRRNYDGCPSLGPDHYMIVMQKS